MSKQIFSTSIKYSSGDLLFYYNKSEEEGVKDANSTSDIEPEMREAITAASVVEDEEFRQIYHCAMVLGGGEGGGEQQKELLVHASDHGVVVQTFGETILELKPHFIELCHVQLEDSWKREAVQWALGELGNEYNDLYSSECVNSQGKRAFYCSQLVVEAYRQTSKADTNPFLTHELNFLGADGKMLPYWVDYYSQLSPQNPEPPQGQPGSHPSVKN